MISFKKFTRKELLSLIQSEKANFIDLDGFPYAHTKKTLLMKDRELISNVVSFVDNIIPYQKNFIISLDTLIIMFKEVYGVKSYRRVLLNSLFILNLYGSFLHSDILLINLRKTRFQKYLREVFERANRALPTTSNRA